MFEKKQDSVLWKETESWADRDFVLSGEVGPFTQQLALRQGQDAGSLSNQHRVVQATVTWGRWDQVTTLNTQRGGGGEMRRGTQLISTWSHFNGTFEKLENIDGHCGFTEMSGKSPASFLSPVILSSGWQYSNILIIYNCSWNPPPTPTKKKDILVKEQRCQTCVQFTKRGHKFKTTKVQSEKPKSVLNKLSMWISLSLLCLLKKVFVLFLFFLPYHVFNLMNCMTKSWIFLFLFCVYIFLSSKLN